MIDIATPIVPFQSDARPANALASGRRLDEYRIDTILGAGGFGVTYKAWDTLLETWVAIKEYFPVEWSFRDADGVTVHSNAQGGNTGSNGQMSEYLWGLERFLDEARVLARVQHPFVVRVKRYFRAHGTAYIVMDYEEGESLNAVLQDSDTLSEDELRGLLEDVLPALQAVHEQGFLHRDIKPSNLYVRSSDHRVILIDFGAAREAVGRHSKSIISLVTPGYSPPEQYAARNDRHGPWSDIYALGAVLYRCVTGEPPVEAAERLLEDSMEPAAKVCAGRYSAGLLRMIDRALAVRPEHRFKTVAEMQTALNESLVNEEEDDTLILGPLARPSNKSTQSMLASLPATESLLAVEGAMPDDDDLRLLPPLETGRPSPGQPQGVLWDNGEERGSADTENSRRKFWLPLLGGGLTLAMTAAALVWLWPKAPPEQPPAVVRSSPATSLQPPVAKPAVVAVTPPAPSAPVVPAPDSASLNPTATSPAVVAPPSVLTPPASLPSDLAVQPKPALPESATPGLPTPSSSAGVSPDLLTAPPVAKTPITEPAADLAPPVVPSPSAAPAGTMVTPAGATVGARNGTVGSEAVEAPPVSSQKTSQSASPKSASTVKMATESDAKPTGKAMAAGKGSARSSESDAAKARPARRQAAKKRGRTQPTGVVHETTAPARSAPGPNVANPWETPTSTGFNSK